MRQKVSLNYHKNQTSAIISFRFIGARRVRRALLVRKSCILSISIWEEKPTIRSSDRRSVNQCEMANLPRFI